MTDNKESISAKLRRWADIGKHSFPFEAALREFEIEETSGWNDLRELLRRIADEVDAEKREITERYARQSWMNPADAIAKLATGEIEWSELEEAIDHYYLPRPLFEDGEPAQFGDSVNDDNDEARIVRELAYCEDGTIILLDHNPETICETRADIPVKRPQPEVLDADGVPIVVGDKVWILPGKHCETFPLCGYKAGVEYTVSENENAIHKESGRICITGRDCIYGYPRPEQVTHREPDTQERIDEDAIKAMEAYWGCMSSHCFDCPAKVDEKRPFERYETGKGLTVTRCLVAQRLDLLRRQRELDGRDA